MVKNLPTNARDIRDMGSIPESGRSPGRGEANHSNILPWRIPWSPLGCKDLDVIEVTEHTHTVPLTVKSKDCVSPGPFKFSIVLIWKIGGNNSVCGD